MINQLLLKVVKGGEKEYHSNYANTVKYAKLLNQIITGEDIEELLKEANKSADDSTMEQLLQITNLTTTSVCNTLIDTHLKIPQSTSILKVISLKDENKEAEFLKILNTFNGDKSFGDYCSDDFITETFLEPDGFIVFEFESFDNKKEHAKPYPFLVTAEMAIDYKYINNVLQYLIVRQVDKELSRYTLYTKESVIVWQQVEKVEGFVKDKSKENEYEFTSIITDPDTKKSIEANFVTVNDLIYRVIEPKPYKLSKVPAFRIGAKNNKKKGQKGCKYSVIEPCLPYLKKSIKTVSELDLTHHLLAFPHTFAYAPPCKACGGITPEVTDCKVCKGTGQDIQVRSSDLITISLPAKPDPTEIVDLSKMIYSHFPDIEGIKTMQDYVDYLEFKCEKALFSQGAINQKEIANAKMPTATTDLLDEQAKNTTLYRYALHWGNFWQFGISIISEITQIPATPSITIGHDLKFRTKDSYIAELGLLKENGASAIAIYNTNREIIKFDFQDNPAEMNKWSIQQYYMPFKSKNDAQILVLLSKLGNDNYYVVLWTYFDEIFSELALENKDFYNPNFDVKTRNEQVFKKVTEYQQKFKVVAPAFPVVK